MEDGSSLQNDLISWLMDTAEGDELSLTALVQRVIFINFAAIRTSTDVRLPFESPLLATYLLPQDLHAPHI
jgi:hypothetical protein